MKYAKTKHSERIRRYLLDSVRAVNPRVVQDAVEYFQVSRQTIHSHLSALVKLGALKAVGNTRARTYVLGPNRHHAQVFILEGLQESDVYSRDFGFMFKGLPREAGDICHYGFTEMLNNAIDHSGGESVFISVDRTVDKITIWISDNGEGIFNHIARILGLVDPRESILELSKGKLTTDPENHSGQGIFFTSRAFDAFNIYSGDLIFTHDDEFEDDYLLHDDKDHSGTRVLMEIAIDTRKNLTTIFDDYTGGEEEDFSFNTTVVPVKLALYEGERLVSRSQAKRILNRVERFKTVMLDFKGVDFIGQAFADEVFRVFARKNQQITLIPTNMVADVEKMVYAALRHD